MNPSPSPKILSPTALAELAARDAGLCIVDLSHRDTYARAHVPRAVHAEYAELILNQPPAPGLLPPPAQLQRALPAWGIGRETAVVAYDDQGNSRASRLLWTLEAVGHAGTAALLDGGVRAWERDGYDCADANSSPSSPAPADEWDINFNPAVIADKDTVLAATTDPRVTILDARSPEEYAGQKSASSRAGHIPGAVNLNWLDTMDESFCYRPDEELIAMLARVGITDRHDQEIIVYCQTHHRSSHSFVMLRHLRFKNVRGYPGSWSEWGNDAQLPLE